MNALMIVLRLIHVLLGVFWAGTLFFFVSYFQPSVRAAGPEGGRVVLELQRRRFLDVLPVIAALTILSGLLLYWLVPGGLNPAWMASPTGLSLGLGGLAAIVAFVLGVSRMRPAALRAGALAQAAAQLPPGPQRDAQLAEVNALRQRAAMTARWVAALLAVAVTGMAVARYL